MAGTKKGVQITVEEDLSTVVIGGANVEVSADGQRVTAYANGVETKAAAAPSVANEGTQINVSRGFKAVVLNGVSIEQAADGHLVIAAPGTVFTKAAVANDRAAPSPGDTMPDGTIYAGISPDTQKAMYTTPEDAPLTHTWIRLRASHFPVSGFSVCSRWLRLRLRAGGYLKQLRPTLPVLVLSMHPEDQYARRVAELREPAATPEGIGASHIAGAASLGKLASRRNRESMRQVRGRRCRSLSRFLQGIRTTKRSRGP
jgi:hypothetical protein